MSIFENTGANVLICIGLSILQVMPFLYTCWKLRDYGNIFPFADFTQYTLKNKLLVFPVRASSDFKEIVESSNKYLLKNEGTADYSLLKDITERRIEMVYQAAVSVISMPMYLGLMGTFLGVGYGLITLITLEGANNAAPTIQSEDLGSFLGGVVVAMFSSFIGLLLTTIANLVASRSQKLLDLKKNAYLSFLQIELLPEMGSSLVESLTRLKNTIGGFESSFTKVINQFESTFSSLTNDFGTDFRKNISTIHVAVDSLGKNMQNISETMKLQKQVLAEISSHRIIEVIQYLYKVFKEFEGVVPLLKEFQDNQSQLNQATANLREEQISFVEHLQTPLEIINKLSAVLDRISTFEKSINDLGESISDAQYLGKKEIAYINNALRSLEEKHSLAARYTETGMETLDLYYSNSLRHIEEMRTKFETQIRTAFDFQIEGNSFKHLEYLVTIAEMLPAMKSEMETLRAEIIQNGRKQSGEIIEAINQKHSTFSTDSKTLEEDVPVSQDSNHKGGFPSLVSLFKGRKS